MVTILNIRLKAITQQQLLADLKEGVLFTPNIDHLVKLQHDKAFGKLINRPIGWFATQEFSI